jgi:hypothetical protein
MTRWYAAAVFALLAAALQAQSMLPRNTYTIAGAPPELRPHIARADLIVTSLHDSMIRELNEALDKGGAPFAMKSCHIDVIGAIHRLGRYEGIAAGRTSDRLRSPTNAPRRWAAPLVAANAGRKARDVDGFAVDLGDKVGVLRPIAERPMCASCHGSKNTLSPAILHDLGERYPVDRATGFEEGEIRGWFWVEMPKNPRLAR